MSACFWASFACDQLRPTARRVMRSKSKCGSTFCSASSTTFVRLPDCTSLSDLMTASTSSATRFTRASGVSCANAVAGRRSARHIARMRNMAGNLGDFGEPDSTSTREPRSGGLFLRLFLRLAEEELPDELLEHHRRLRDGDAVAGDRKSTRLNSSHEWISYAVFCLKKKKEKKNPDELTTYEERRLEAYQ